MAIKLIYGKQRKVLREACLAQVCSLTGNWPGKRAILLVPEQTKMDMERDYLRQSGQAGLMMAEVLSFRRLAWRLLGDVGRQPLQPVDRVGQSMLIHQVLKQQQANLHTFGFLADKPGFISQVAAVIGDLKRYGISGSQLLQLDIAQADVGLKNKAGDLGILLKQYDLALAETGLGDADDDLNRLADVLQTLVRLPGGPWPWPWQRLEWLRRTHVWVSGFGELRDFTPQEDAVLAGLASLAEDMTFSVAADHIPGDRLAVEAGPDSFLPGRRTAWRLRTIYPGMSLIRTESALHGLAGQISVCLIDNRQAFTPELPEQSGASAEAAASAAPAASAARAAADSYTLKLIQADGLDDELGWVAGEIRQLVQLEGYRYGDITLALCDMPGYGARLRAVCREYDIPVFLDQEKPLSGTPLLRFVLGLLDIDLTGWSRNALMSCLRSGMTLLSGSEIDLLENEWLARGLFRYSRLFNDHLYQDRVPPSKRIIDGETADDGEAGDAGDAGDDDEAAEFSGARTEKKADYLLSLRDKGLLPLRRVLTELRKAAHVEDKCLVLRQFLADFGLEERIRAKADSLVNDGEMDAAVSLVQSWNELDRLLDQMSHLAGKMTFSLQTYRDVLAAGMDSAASSIIPTAIDQVGVGDLRRAMLRQPRVLFLIGASAANLPPPPPPEGLLKDQDRQTLSRLLDRQLPSIVRDQSFADAFVLYTLLTLPTGKLYITAPDDGVSPVFRWLSGQVKDALCILPQLPGWQDVRLNALRPALNRLQSVRKGLAGLPGEQQDGWLTLRRVLDESSGTRLSSRLDHPWPDPSASLFVESEDEVQAGDSRLGAAMTLALYGQPVTMSVSRLESYARCPFKHLSEHLMNLQDRPVWAPQATETGIVLHGIMELAINSLSRELISIDPSDPAVLNELWQKWLDRDLDQPIRSWMAEVVGRDGLERFFDHGLQASVGRRIRKMAASSIHAVLRQYQDQEKPFLPVRLEWVFGRTDRPLLLRIPGCPPVQLRGKVDRVDERAGQQVNQFRIIDYKSGSSHVDYEDLYQGLALQMPIYLAAYSRLHPELQAADAAYFHLEHPILTLAAGDIPDDAGVKAKLLHTQDLHGMKLDPEDLERVCRHALREAAGLAASMLIGAFPAFPCKKPGRQPACDFCAFQAFCGFDGRFDPYRRPAPLRGRPRPDGKIRSKKDEMIQRLRERESIDPDQEEG